MFTKVKVDRVRRSTFDLSHERKFSAAMGDLVPILCQEVVPGDSFRLNSEVFARMAPMLAPIMHRIDVDVHHFFVPNRLVWNEWKDFITGGVDGTAAPVFPTLSNVTIRDVSTDYLAKGSMWDYFGMPPHVEPNGITKNITVNALPFRAHALIYKEYFRDQTLEPDSVQDPAVDISSGPITDPDQIFTLCSMRKRAWRKDYFTSALPWSQRGGEVAIPAEDYNNPAVARLASGAAPSGLNLNLDGGGNVVDGGSNFVSLDVGAGIFVNDLRRSMAIQKWLEKMARGGSRYIEQMMVMFGVKSSDARLQRPEYLGGGRQHVSISEVVSTFEESAGGGEPQGNMAGHGVTAGSVNGFKHFFEEHGFVISYVSILPKTAYQNGFPRVMRKYDRFDYAWPDFAHLGEQEIKMFELWFDDQSADDIEETFGYTPRYAEYKYVPDSVHGEFRDSLSFWHDGRIFSAKPALNAAFVKSDPSTRIFAVSSTEQVYFQVYHKLKAIRPLPYFGTPKL